MTAKKFNYSSEVEQIRVSLEVLNVLERFGHHTTTGTNSEDPKNCAKKKKVGWIGKYNFLPHVYHYVRQGKPVMMTLPAFPCKSANREFKVLGHLPDMGEELALRRLHAMGTAVGKVYSPGATINIATDGVFFSDIIGITDEDCWEYGEALEAMILEKGFTTLRFVRPMTLLNLSSFEENNRENYLASVEVCREELMKRFGPSGDDISKAILSDKDVGMTYCGMVKFLESELQTNLGLEGLNRTAKRKAHKAKARKMMQRSEAFTKAIRTMRPLDVRLSMHPSTGAAKLSFPLIPSADGGFQKSPWHSCVAFGADGRFKSVHSGEVKDTHDLIYRKGRPYFYIDTVLLPTI